MLQSQISLSRLGKPEEIAAVVGFLCSESGGYVTGETIQVNGGMYMG
jgi:3-oxoacyl-[acyl-carrier protein] reductase